MKRLFREPLFHFLLLGAALFAASAWLAGPSDGARAEAGEIVVTQGRIRHLAETFDRQWNRVPSADELAGLVRAYVREEVLAREALALGLDRDDTVVRRRLAQKMEFVTDDTAALVEPGDDDLRAWLAAHPERFRSEPHYTFSQVFLDPQKRGKGLAEDAARLLARLEAAGAAADPAAVSDSRMLEAHWAEAPHRDVEAQLGGQFAGRLAELPIGRWHGPVASAYGAHLVRVEAREPGRQPRYEEIRVALARDWTAAKQRELKEARFQTLLAKYKVTVEDASGVADDKLAAR